MTLENMLDATGRWTCARDERGLWEVKVYVSDGYCCGGFCMSLPLAMVATLNHYADKTVHRYRWVKSAIVTGAETGDSKDAHWTITLANGFVVDSDRASLADVCESVNPKPSSLRLSDLVRLAKHKNGDSDPMVYVVDRSVVDGETVDGDIIMVVNGAAIKADGRMVLKVKR